mgnify:FL=1
MSTQTNEFGQPIGAALPDWQSALAPPETEMLGRYCRVEPLIPAIHSADLFQAFSDDKDGRLWTYMAAGPFNSEDQFTAWVETVSGQQDLSLIHI